MLLLSAMRVRRADAQRKIVERSLDLRRRPNDDPRRPDCVAGHEGLELGNVIANYPFESPRRFSGPNRIPVTETIRV
jgi:hypothetical protein